MKRVLPLLGALALAATAAHAQVPAGGEFRVNTWTTGHQYFPAAAFDRLGNFVVVWSSYEGASRATEVKAQRYARSGTPAGAEFTVNTYTTGFQYTSTLGTPIAMRPDGRFVVVWTSTDGTTSAIFGQRFEADGTRSGAEFRVDVGATVDGASPSVAVTPYGAFVVAWSGAVGLFMNATEIHAQRFDASGNRLAAPFVVNSSTYLATRVLPRVGLDGGGAFTVVWQHRVPLPGGPQFSSDVVARRFGADGAPIAGEFRVNTYTPGRQLSYSLACGPDGDFIVSWDGAGDASAGAILAQRYDSAGAPVGGEFVVNSDTTGVQAYGSVAADLDSNFVASWQSASDDGNGYSIRAQRFDRQGARRGLEFRVNTYTTLSQNGPNVAVDEVGNFLVLWHSDRQDGSDLGVYAQRYGGLNPTLLRVDVAGGGILEPGEVADVRPSWSNFNGAARTFAGTISNPAGPPGGVPQILVNAADYGTVPNGAVQECLNCYSLAVPDPQPRPVVHWDSTVLESITPDVQGQRKTWRLHVGATFADVPRASAFYPFVETITHYDVTGGCSVTNGVASYCPTLPTSREQMAVFVLMAKEGSGYAPPPCGAPVFADVPASSPFCAWIEELARRGVVAGCGGGNYCPTLQVTREQMAVFVLRAAEPSLVPPPCAPPNLFGDVPETSPFCPWIEELALRGVVTGCGGGNYCPGAFVTREQMGVFIAETFQLALYGP